MSKSSTATAPKQPAALPSKSAWSRGPPQTQQQSVSPSISRSQSPSNANPPQQTHSRRPSGLSGIPIKDGVGVSVAKSIQAPRPASVINFGSIADVSAPVSSSPAAVPTVSRDASNVKSFGSIAANSNGTSPAVTTAPTATAPSSSNTTAPSTPAPTTVSVTSATPAKKKIDIHKLFQGGGSSMPSPPPQATFGEVPSPPPRQNTLPTAQPQPPQGQHYPYNPPHLRGPNGVGAGGPRSPQFSRAMPNGGPRPPGGPNNGPASAGAMGSPRLQQQQQAATPQPPAGHPPPQMPPMPQMPQMPPQQWGGYYYYPPPQTPYDPHMPPAPYWAPHPPPPVNHAPPHIPVSPRAQQQPLASPVPPPTPPAAITSTPPSARLHPTAPSFVPRQSKITIKSPNGEAVDLQKFRKPDGSLESPTVENSPKAKPDRRSAVIRMESEDARKARLEEEERKEKAKREEEAKAKAKQEAEERAKKELEAEKKRKEEEEAEAKRREEEAARKKKEQEEAEAERLRKEEEEREKQRELERKQAEEEAERLRLEEEERKAREAEEARIREEEAAKEAQRRKEEEEREKEKERERELEREREKEREREQEKEREKERARALQQEATSPATSSPASPAVPLPKPALETKKRPVPGRLDLTSTAKSDLPKPLPSALASARIIDKLEMVNYPSGVSAPKEELNVNAPDGKFRYDRDFLLQFMSLCKDKPDLLPPLENLGIELSEQGSNSPYPMGRGGSGRRQGSSSMAPPNSANPRIGLGISGSGGIAAFGGKSGQGAFGGMGSFQPPGRMPSSEERFAASNANRSASVSGAAPGGGALPFPRAPLIRSTSQGGPGGVSGTNRVRSQRGGKRTESNKLGNPPPGFQPGTPSQISQSLDPVAPLVSTANRWTSNRGTGADQEASLVVERKVKSLLNKLTMEKFDSISNQIITWANESEKEADGRTLILVIKLVFEKATDEAAWSEMYARLCRKMMEQISPNVHDESIKNAEGLPITGGQLFRKYLLNRCQEDFERGWAAHDTAAAAAAAKAGDDQAIKDANGKSGEEALYSDEYYVAQKAKRQGLGLVKFIGELFKLQMLTERIMHECIKKLLSNVKNPEEEEIESLCKLLSTVGQALDTSKARNHMDIYFDRMQELSSSSNISSRMQFMLLDVIELRARKWVARNATAAPSTIAQVHEAAAKEKAAAEKESYSRQNRESMSRGGSRRGDHRSEFSQGPDGWTNVAPAAAPRPPAKAGDLTHFGKISKPTAMSFGPSSVFAGKKEGKSGRDSPSLSRANSSSNMFSMLSNAESAGDASGPPSNSRPPSRKTSVDLTQSGIPTEGGGRKRLQLLPRSKPLNDDTGKVDEEAAPDSSDDEADAAPQMTEDQVKAKVEEDVKEMLAVRDIGESESYFSSLPPQYHHILVDKIFSKVLDSKEADIKLASEVFARAIEKALCSQAEFEQGFTPTIEFLDDICVDAPAAYSVAARLLKAAGLPRSSVQNLAAKITVEGDPITQPADKLMKEFTALA